MSKKSIFDIGLNQAINGIKYAIISEKNLKIQIIMAGITVLAAIYFKTSAIENMILSITIFFVIFAEVMNTAIEKTVDLVCKDVLKKSLGENEFNLNAGLAKDISAGAVLISAINSVIVGCMIFLPKVLAVLNG